MAYGTAERGRRRAVEVKFEAMSTMAGTPKDIAGAEDWRTSPVALGTKPPRGDLRRIAAEVKDRKIK